MRVLSDVHLACEFAKLHGKPVLYLNFAGVDDPTQAAPYLNYQDHIQMIVDGVAFVVCDDMEECERLYATTVGADGPTPLNPYAGPDRVYALTIDSTGQPRNENT